MGLTGGDRQQGGTRRWTDVTIRAALAEFLGDRSTWPTKRRHAGRGGLHEALWYHGGSQRWAVEMGVAAPAPPRRRSPPAKPTRASRPKRAWPSWTERRIATELSAFLANRGEWPRYAEFVDAGRKGLYHAVRNTGGAHMWAPRMGVGYVKRRGGLPTYWTEERVRERMAGMLEGRILWPTTREFEAADEGRLLAAARRLGGVERWMAEFALRRTPVRRSHSAQPRLWTDSAIMGAIAPLVTDLGRWPTKGEFRTAGLTRALAAVYYHGGSAAWQHRLGVTATVRPSRAADHIR